MSLYVAAMELLDLESHMKFVAHGGNVLNCQETAGLQAGLALLKVKEQHDQIYFWGKVFGQTADYFVAYGLRAGTFEFPGKAFYFSGPDFQFQAMAPPTGQAAERVAELCGDKPLTGVASKVIEPPKEGEEEPPADDDGAADRPPPARKLMEADRLAQLVQQIDFETSAVPTGAYSVSDSHAIVPSKDFKGLGFTEASTVGNYVHFRPPVTVACLRALARNDAQFQNGFLDPLESDQPKGCWALRQDPSANFVTLRSLSWPGYVAFHAPGTTRFGGLYFGYAQKCFELPFLL